MNTQQALEILAEAINKGVACNIYSKAEIAGINQAFLSLQKVVKEKEEKNSNLEA